MNGFGTRVTRGVPHVEQKLEHLIFSGVRVARSLVFCVMFCRFLIVLFCVLLYFFFWPLYYCLSSFDLRFRIIPLVLSNSSYILDHIAKCYVHVCHLVMLIVLIVSFLYIIYPSRAPKFTPGFLVGSVLLIFLVFVLSYYVSLRNEFRFEMSVTISV